jgi:hypothetical protein
VCRADTGFLRGPTVTWSFLATRSSSLFSETTPRFTACRAKSLPGSQIFHVFRTIFKCDNPSISKMPPELPKGETVC